MKNISFHSWFLFFISSTFLLLNVSHVFAIEKALVNPSSFSLNMGESKNITVTGKNLNNAKSALVFLKNSPRKEFSTKLTCQGATRCIVSLTLKGEIAPGGYSVKLFDAKKKPIAEAQFKFSLPSGKTVSKTSRKSRSKAKQSPSPVTKANPRPRQEIKPKSKPTPPVVKTAPQKKLGLRGNPGALPPQRRNIPQRTRPSKPDNTQRKPLVLPELASIKLTKRKAHFGETVKGTVALKGKAPAPKGINVVLSSSNSKIARVMPVQIRSGRTKADFSFKAGSTPGNVTLKAQLGKKTLATTLVVTKPPFRPVVINPETLKMTGRRPTPFRPVVINPETLKMTGRRPSSFRPVVINPETLKMTGRRPTPFRPVVINPETLKMTGRRPSSFRPVVINPETLKMTGRRPTPFHPVVINPETLKMTGRRPVPYSPIQGTFQMTGKRPVPYSPIQGTFRIVQSLTVQFRELFG